MELLNKLKPNPNNPRTITKEQFEKLIKNIKALPKMLEIHKLAYDSSKDYIVYGGNQRLEALKLLAKEGFEIKDSWFIDIKGWTDEQIKQFIITDNLAYGNWDWDRIANEWSNYPLEEWGLDPTEWNKEEEKLDDDYSQKIGEVIYEPKQTNHKISDLFQAEHKFDEEINKLKNEELKEMLKARVAYFSNFSFTKIADYYAYQATPEEQRIFEKLALVLLDKDKLIENGFSKIINSLNNE